MATSPTIETVSTEEALRARIHRLFSDECSGGDVPAFWVGPTDDIVMNIKDHLTLSDHVDVEQLWLKAEKVELGGRSPEEMLHGDEVARSQLESVVAALEDAVRGGGFR